MIESSVSENLLFIMAVIVFAIALISILVHWSFLAKRALERGNIRIESMKEVELNADNVEDMQDHSIKYTHLKR